MTARSAAGFASLGWSVHEHAVPGFWRRPDAASFAALAGAMDRIPDGAVVLLDGLIASTAPEVLVPQTRRLRLVVLVHMPLGHRPADRGVDEARTRERAVLSAATAVVTTSAWTRRRLLELYSLPADRVHVAEPAVDAADLATPSAPGDALLCVAAVTFDKGHDVLLDCAGGGLGPVLALRVRGQPGPRPSLRGRAPSPVTGRRAGRPRAPHGTAHRGRPGPQLRRRGPGGACLAGRDVRHGRHRGAGPWGAGAGGRRRRRERRPSVTARTGSGPELLVPPGDPAALATALRAWLGDVELRARLRRAARERRGSLPGWSTTASVIAACAGRGLAMTADAIRVSSEWLALREPADAAARARDLVDARGATLSGEPVGT